MRIYWSGALYFLKADIALRNQSNGTVGLNNVLLKLNQCCVNSAEIWSGKELAGQLDKLSETKIFSQLFTEFSNGTEFPEYQTTFKALGVSIPKSKSSIVEIATNSLAQQIMK